MRKPRIILADTDLNYVAPIQLKFAEEFFQKIELEIITDPVYFEELFSRPQRADILIISEGLYTPSVQRHNIEHIFLMLEQPDTGSTGELNVDRIFKYTSLKEIFNVITGKSADVLSLSLEKQEPQIILICSGSGGVGKTTVALGVSACLAKAYKRVLYINACHLQTFQRVLKDSSCISAGDVYTKLAHRKEFTFSDIRHVIRQESFYYLPPFKATLMSLGLPYSVFGKIAKSARDSGDYDFIVLDAETDFDEDLAELIHMADRVLIVTNQGMAPVYATNALVGNIGGITGEKYLFICNNFDKDKENALSAPGMSVRFSVSSYIEHLEHFDSLSCDDLARNSSMQSAALLVM